MSQATPASSATPADGAVVAAAEINDVIEVHGIPGSPTRRGLITEVIGAGVHQHYRVRWDEEHESLFFPGAGEGVHVFHKADSAAAAHGSAEPASHA